MSDLQCPATVYLVQPGAEVPERLPDEVPAAAVWSGPARAQAGAAFARSTDCALRDEPALDLDAWDALDLIADLHRGESVLALPGVAYPGLPADACGWIRLDGDGRTVSSTRPIG